MVGFWAGDGSSLRHDLVSYVAFRTRAVIIAPLPCAASAEFYISIVNTCEITSSSGFSAETVNLWTHTNLDTPYGRVSELMMVQLH